MGKIEKKEKLQKNLKKIDKTFKKLDLNKNIKIEKKEGKMGKAGIGIAVPDPPPCPKPQKIAKPPPPTVTKHVLGETDWLIRCPFMLKAKSSQMIQQKLVEAGIRLQAARTCLKEMIIRAPENLEDREIQISYGRSKSWTLRFQKEQVVNHKYLIFDIPFDLETQEALRLLNAKHPEFQAIEISKVNSKVGDLEVFQGIWMVKTTSKVDDPAKDLSGEIIEVTLHDTPVKLLLVKSHAKEKFERQDADISMQLDVVLPTSSKRKSDPDNMTREERPRERAKQRKRSPSCDSS